MKISNVLKRIMLIAFAVMLTTGCAADYVLEDYYDEVETESRIETVKETLSEAASETETAYETEIPGEDEFDFENVEAVTVEEDAYYYDFEHVVMYLETYGELPHNYVTKDEARAAGWDEGTVEVVLPDMAIGGDIFYDFEDNIPDAPGVKCYECDIDTHHYKNRGSRRVVYTSDGRYYYTSDHYETFTELFVEDGCVLWD